MDYLRVQVIIHGLVQGVAFRAYTRSQAAELDVKGWVRNLPDGTVQACFEGEKKKVAEMLVWCRQGPIGARVMQVDVTKEPYTGEFMQFDIRYGI
jgi:acylphosphatase